MERAGHFHAGCLAVDGRPESLQPFRPHASARHAPAGERDRPQPGARLRDVVGAARRTRHAGARLAAPAAPAHARLVGLRLLAGPTGEAAGRGLIIFSFLPWALTWLSRPARPRALAAPSRWPHPDRPSPRMAG